MPGVVAPAGTHFGAMSTMKPTKILVLLNMVTKEELQDDEEYKGWNVVFADEMLIILF